MPKINTTPFKEGDVIRKSDITSIKDEIEVIDFDLDEDNLREEGLDRRVFDTNPWTSTPSNLRIASPFRVAKHESWNRLIVPSAAGMTGSASEVSPVIYIPWDTEHDTDVIIRCSFSVYSEGSQAVRLQKQCWDFGLLVTPAGREESFRLTPTRLNGGIYPYTRIGLCDAFSNQALDGGYGSKGAHYQHKHRKESHVSQSVTLIYHAHSANMNDSIPSTDKTDNSFVWNTSGTAKVSLAHRNRNSTSSSSPSIRIRGFNLSYQKFRR